MKRGISLRRFFAAATRRAHGFDRQRGRNLNFDGDATRTGDDAVKKVRPSQLVLTRRQKLAEEPSVDILEILEPASGRADDVIAALEAGWFDAVFFSGFAANGKADLV